METERKFTNFRLLVASQINFITTFAPMRNFVKGVILMAVALLYIVSTMGYGVHSCTVDGTAEVIMLFGETPCESAHSEQEHSNSQNCSGSCTSECHHSDNCCSTNVYVVTQDQNILEDNISFTPQCLPINFELSDAEVSVKGFSQTDSLGGKFIPIAERKVHYQSVICTFLV